MRTLGTILCAPDSINPDLVILAPWTRPLTASSPAILVEPDAEPTDGDLAYLLGASIAQEVLGVWSAWRHGVRPSIDDCVRAVEHYADHDGYLPLDLA